MKVEVDPIIVHSGIEGTSSWGALVRWLTVIGVGSNITCNEDFDVPNTKK
jgi:hypothetical protein